MSTPTYNFATPDGQYPPLAVITDDDHRAWIIIATALGLAIVLLFAAIRAFVRFTFSDGFGIDDAFIGASTSLTVVQSALILSATGQGLGQSLKIAPENKRDEVEQKIYAAQLLFIIALGLSKVSVAMFLRRLTPVKAQRKVFVAGVGVIGIWTVASLFAIALQCNLAHPWSLIGEQCGTGVFTRWRAICAFDILLEIGLVGLSTYLVWGLKTTWQNKGLVVMAFAFRLIMIIAIGFRLGTFDQVGLTTNPFISEDQFIVWTQTELCYSIISSTVPTLRPFVNNFTTHYGGSGQKSGHSYGSGYATHSQENNNVLRSTGYQLKSVTRSKNRDKHDDAVEPEERAWEGPVDAYQYGVAGNSKVKKEHDKSSGDARSIGSNDSQRMIIRKDVTWAISADR